ncbi:unnamed protein product [Acanthocheilonema viteae]|uniref:Uncharacterized protein n=1 Tax=Acanthocheilonema viteae TaxID=6277 RepID=A0A498SEQ1_ACAVI|nr:unnamed protein product [Acanthocheilonema viteae]
MTVEVRLGKIITTSKYLESKIRRVVVRDEEEERTLADTQDGKLGREGDTDGTLVVPQHITSHLATIEKQGIPLMRPPRTPRSNTRLRPTSPLTARERVISISRVKRAMCEPPRQRAQFPTAS